MESLRTKNITWLFAFKSLFIGESTAIGKHPKWKKTVLQLAIVAPIAFGFVGWQQISIMSGNVPPQAPLIHGTGMFMQITHGQASYVAFVSDDGHVYNMERGTTIRGNNYMPQGDPPPRVYAEGFLRENGKGYFWPTFIKTTDGNIIISPEKSMDILRKRIESIYKISLAYIFIISALWAASVYFLYSVKRNLSTRM